jgi:hypothetical protein
MPTRRYEVRIAGRLSSRARDAFVGMDVDAVPAETVITGTLDDDDALLKLLDLIQSLGLSVLSIEQVTPASRPTPRGHGLGGTTSAPGAPAG